MSLGPARRGVGSETSPLMSNYPIGQESSVTHTTSGKVAYELFLGPVIPDFITAAQALQAPRQTGRYVDEIVVFGDTGLIRVRYGSEEANEAIRGDFLYLRPIIDDVGGLVTWECSSWLEDKYLPSACQGIEPPDIAGEANTGLRPIPEHVAQH